MIKPIICHNCKKEVKELPFKVSWKYETDKCNHCFHEKDLYHEYEFCSSKCLRVWSKKFDKHEHKWIVGSGASLYKNGKVKSVMTQCKICKENNYHCKDKKAIEKWKERNQQFYSKEK